MNFKLTNEFIHQVQNLIHDKSDAKIKSMLSGFFPQDLAEIISALSIKDAKYLFELLKENSAEILVELEDNLKEEILSSLSTRKIAKNLIENLETDDAADVIQEFSEPIKKEILSQINNQEHADDIEDLLTYSDDSAGALMGKELIKVNKNWSVIRCLGEMRKQAENIEKVYTIYVVDKSNKLVGTVSLKKLLISSEKTFIEKI